MMLNSASPHTDPWGAPPITGPHLETESTPLEWVHLTMSGPLRGELPSTVTHHLFLVLWVVTWGADGVALLSSSTPFDVMGLFSLQSIDVVLQRCLQHQGKSLPPSITCHCMFPISCITVPSALCPPPPLAVCADPSWSCTLREVPTLLPWGSETVSDFDPSRQPQNDSRLLDYVDLESQLLASGMSLFWRDAIPAVMKCHNHPWSDR